MCACVFVCLSKCNACAVCVCTHLCVCLCVRIHKPYEKAACTAASSSFELLAYHLFASCNAWLNLCLYVCVRVYVLCVCVCVRVREIVCMCVCLCE